MESQKDKSGIANTLAINSAATLVASGHGLIEVRIPSQTAVGTAVADKIMKAA